MNTSRRGFFGFLAACAVGGASAAVAKPGGTGGVWPEIVTRRMEGDIKTSAVTTAKIADNAITMARIAPGGMTWAEFQEMSARDLIDRAIFAHFKATVGDRASSRPVKCHSFKEPGSTRTWHIDPECAQWVSNDGRRADDRRNHVCNLDGSPLRFEVPGRKWPLPHLGSRKA